jgi:hypothetical protein
MGLILTRVSICRGCRLNTFTDRKHHFGKEMAKKSGGVPGSSAVKGSWNIGVWLSATFTLTSQLSIRNVAAGAAECVIPQIKERVMKIQIAVIGMALLFAGCQTTPKPVSKSGLIEPLRPYAKEAANSLGKVSRDRRLVLDQIDATIIGRLAGGHDAELTFICTQNSRRSHMPQIWAQTAAC